MKNRKQAVKQYQQLYTHVYHKSKGDCVYCGERKNCLDHVPPISLLDGVSLHQLHEKDIPLLLVPACSDCNQLLSDRAILTLPERLAFLYDSYLKRLDTSNEWQKEELEELTGNLLQMVKARQQAYKNLLIQKLSEINNNLSIVDEWYRCIRYALKNDD